jgi:hypothetical protein
MQIGFNPLEKRIGYIVLQAGLYYTAKENVQLKTNVFLYIGKLKAL